MKRRKTPCRAPHLLTTVLAPVSKRSKFWRLTLTCERCPFVVVWPRVIMGKPVATGPPAIRITLVAVND